MQNKKFFVILYSLILVLSFNVLAFAEELEPIEDPDVYEKFDILEGLSKKEFAKRLEEQERILEELEDEIDVFQYSMFREQYHKNVAYYEENYKTKLTEIKENFQDLVDEFFGFMVGILFFVFLAFFVTRMTGTTITELKKKDLTEDELLLREIKKSRKKERKLFDFGKSNKDMGLKK